jgi:hypothetical protein
MDKINTQKLFKEKLCVNSDLVEKWNDGILERWDGVILEHWSSFASEDRRD